MKKKRTTIALTVAALLILAVTGGYYFGQRKSRGFPETYKDNFIAACIAKGSTAARCRCSLKVMQREYKYEEALALEVKGQLPPGLAKKVAEECN